MTEREYPPFHPPADWEAEFAAEPEMYRFGSEPSQLARVAFQYFTAFGGDPATAAALDLGCGEGRDTVYLAAQGLSVTARDAAPTGLAKLERLRLLHSVPPERIDAKVEDVRTFAYPAQAYDIALAANVFQFLPPEEVPTHLMLLQQAVRPGGLCAIGVFHPAMLAWSEDVARHFTATAEELAAFFLSERGWLLCDRTEYWTYRIPDKTWITFTYLVARKEPTQ